MSDSPLDRLDDPRIKQIPLSRWPAALDRPSVDAQELALRVMTEAALSEEGVRELAQTDAVEKVSRLMISETDILAMYACWFVSNMCASSDDSIRIAFGKAGILNYYPLLFQTDNPLLLEKVLWSVTNLAQTPVIRKAMGIKGVSSALVELFIQAEKRDKRQILQPIINLLLDDDFHQTFYEAKGVDTVVELLSSEDEATVSAALTALLYLSVSLEDVRTALVSKHQILMQLSNILESSTGNQVRDMSLQLLTNLSFSDVNEIPIAESGILLSVIDLLGSAYENLQSRSAMLLANVSLNESVRDRIRLFGWAEPAISAISKSNADVQLQILRFVLNVSLDDFCRQLLINAQALTVLNKLLFTIPPNDERLELVQSVVSNLEAPVPQEIQDQFKVKAPVQPTTAAASADVTNGVQSPATAQSNIAATQLSQQQSAPKGGFVTAQPNKSIVNNVDAIIAATMQFDAADAPMYARRERVAKELLQTELTYNATLGVMKRDFLMPLRQAALVGKAILSDDEIHKIFSVTEVLANIHATFCNKLEARIRDWKWDTCVADIFIDMGEMLKAYKPYINNYDTALQFYSSVATKKKTFQAFIKEASAKHPELSSAGLPHFLIQPIQRVPRYVMLLDQLHKFTPESHADFQNLAVALDKIKKITEYLNEAKRNAENVNKILDIENTVTGLNGPLLVVGRRFVKEGTAIEERKGGSRTVLLYLFNDMLIICKVVKKLKRTGALGTIDKSYQVLRHVPLPDVSSVTVPDEEGKSAKLLISCKPDGEWNGQIMLNFTTSEDRDGWMNSISQARNSALAKVLRDRRASVATDPKTSSPSRSPSSPSLASGHVRTSSSDTAASQTVPVTFSPTTISSTTTATPSLTPSIPAAGSPALAPLPMAIPTDPAQAQQMQQQLQMQIQTMAHMLAMMQMQQGGPTEAMAQQQQQLMQMMASSMAMMQQAAGVAQPQTQPQPPPNPNNQ